MQFIKKFRDSRYALLSALVVGIISAIGVSVWATSVGSDITTANLTVTGTLTETGAFTINTTSATSTLSTGGLSVGSGQFVVQQTSGNTGIGSTTPWGLLSVEQNSLEWVFVVADKGTTSPSFVVNGSGRVGAGTSTPAQTLSVGGSLFVGASAVGGTVGGLGVGNATTTAGVIENTGNVLLGSSATNQVGINGGSIILNNIGTTTIAQRNVAAWSIATSSSPAPLVRYDTTNTRVGIATGTPTATLTVKGDTYTTGGLGVGEGSATTTPGVMGTALSSTTASLFQSDLSLQSPGTTTLRIGTPGSFSGGRGCIQFHNGDGNADFRIYATTTGFALIESGTCE